MSWFRFIQVFIQYVTVCCNFSTSSPFDSDRLRSLVLFLLFNLIFILLVRQVEFSFSFLAKKLRLRFYLFAFFGSNSIHEEFDEISFILDKFPFLNTHIFISVPLGFEYFLPENTITLDSVNISHKMMRSMNIDNYITDFVACFWAQIVRNKHITHHITNVMFLKSWNPSLDETVVEGFMSQWNRTEQVLMFKSFRHLFKWQISFWKVSFKQQITEIEI